MGKGEPPVDAVGAYAVIHSLNSETLNGAVVYIEANADPAGLASVRVLSPPDAARLNPGVTQLTVCNLRACKTVELGTLYENNLPEQLWQAIRTASRELLRTADETGELSWRDKRRLARECALVLWSVAAQCLQAAAWLDAAAEAYQRDGVGGADQPSAASLYSFMHAVCCANVGFACALRGDAAGELSAYSEAFYYSLARPGVGELAQRFSRPLLVAELALRCGEAFRAAGRMREALPPLQLAAAEAVEAQDGVLEGQAEGTLSLVQAALGQLGEAEASGARELALLRARISPGGGSLALARALAGLGAVKCGRAVELQQLVPVVRRLVAATVSEAAELIESAYLEVREHARSDGPPDGPDVRAAWGEVSACLRAAMKRLGALRADLRSSVLAARDGGRSSAASEERSEGSAEPPMLLPQGEASADGHAALTRVPRPTLAGALLPPLRPGSAASIMRNTLPAMLLQYGMPNPAGKKGLDAAAAAAAEENEERERRERRQLEKTAAAQARKRAKRAESGSPVERLAQLMLRCIKLLIGKYIMETYIVDKNALVEAYELTTLTATLVLQASVGLFNLPEPIWDEWRESLDFTWDAPPSARPSHWIGNKNNLQFLGFISVFIIMTGLGCLLSAMGILSVVNLLGDSDDKLRRLVLEKWYMFAFPILLNQAAIVMFIAAILGISSYEFGKRTSQGGLVWAIIVFSFGSLFQLLIADAVHKVNYPAQWTFRSVINERKLITVTVVPPEDMPPEEVKDYYIKDDVSRLAFEHFSAYLRQEEERKRREAVTIVLD